MWFQIKFEKDALKTEMGRKGKEGGRQALLVREELQTVRPITMQLYEMGQSIRAGHISSFL